MADPVSLVALGAAIGGAAGKLTECAWDQGARWVRRLFVDHSDSVRERAEENTAKFLYELALRVSALEHANHTTPSDVDEALSHPRFSSLLKQTVLAAAQTDDATKHRLLADLVAQRLTVEAESTVALASELAVSAITRATAVQLRLLALCLLLSEIRPEREVDARRYAEWLNQWLQFFEFLEFRQFDAWHLVALACATYQEDSGRSLETLFWLNAADVNVDPEFYNGLYGEWLQVAWDEGLAGMRLTTVGSIVGGLVLARLTGRDVASPRWDA